MSYKQAHAPIYGYLKGVRSTIPLHAVWFARTFSIMRLLNRLDFRSVLNVGGADGLHSRMLSDLFGARTTTLDLSHNFLRAGKDILEGDYVCADARRLPFEDSQFDLVLCVETIEHVPEPERMIAELKRTAGKYVLVSTESYFDSAAQRTAFLNYIRETHPQFFRVENPEQPYDVNHFTMEDLQELLGPEKFSAYPQYDRKRQDIPDSIEDVRAMIRDMTTVDEINRASRIIALLPLAGAPKSGPEKMDEDELLERIVTECPFVDPGEYDRSMQEEDEGTRKKLVSLHRAIKRAHVFNESKRPEYLIEEEGADSMSMRRITGDTACLPTPFSLRKITLGPGGTTPWRNNAWERHAYILDGTGTFSTDDGDTPLEPGCCLWIPAGADHRFTASDAGLAIMDVIPSVVSFFGR